MSIELLYQNGKTKALTFSFDDGQVFDRKLVEIFNKYGMKGTFHLNSGILDRDGFVSKAEVKELYRGHEVACHGVEHKFPNFLSKEQLIEEILEDRRSLEKITGGIVTGMSYAYGQYNDAVVEICKCLGITYSRTVEPTYGFNIPDDFMKWKPTCHNCENILERAQTFLDTPCWIKLPLFYVWGHSYEFNGDKWHVIEDFCKEVAFKEDVWYTTNIDYRNYVTAMKALVFNVDNTIVFNPTGYSVWIKDNDEIIEIKPGQSYSCPIN